MEYLYKLRKLNKTYNWPWFNVQTNFTSSTTMNCGIEIEFDARICICCVGKKLSCK